MWNEKKKEEPKLYVFFIPKSEASANPLTKEFFNKPKVAAAAAAASVLIPLAAHAAVGIVTHLSARSKKVHVMDLQQTVLLQGCFDKDGTSLLDEAFLAFCVGGEVKDEKIPKNPMAMGIWKILLSSDGTAIRLELKKWQWDKFLLPPERSWTCQSLRFRDIAITVEIDYLGDDKKALWEFVFSSVTEEELSTVMDDSTEWKVAPELPSKQVEPIPSTTEKEPSVRGAADIGTEVELSKDEKSTTETEPSQIKPACSESADDELDKCEYFVPANVRIDVIETTRPHVLAPLLHESANASSSIAAPLSKLLQSQISNR